MTLMRTARERDRLLEPRSGALGTLQQVMTAAQDAELKQMSLEARDPQAYDPTLAPEEAAARIAALKAKLPLLGSEEHTE
jgi:hypothetical protein